MLGHDTKYLRVIGPHNVYIVTCYMLGPTMQRDRLTDKLIAILRAAAIAGGRSNYYNRDREREFIDH